MVNPDGAGAPRAISQCALTGLAMLPNIGGTRVLLQIRGAAMPTNLVTGSDSSDSLGGTAAGDLIYGFDPNGPSSDVSSIETVRVATGMFEQVFVGAPPGDFNRLFAVERSGQIKVIENGVVRSTPFL